MNRYKLPKGLDNNRAADIDRHNRAVAMFWLFVAAATVVLSLGLLLTAGSTP